MSTTTEKQQKLVKVRKAARVVGCLLIFGGAVILLFGLAFQSLPALLNGVVLLACSTPLFVASKVVEKKIHDLGV